MDHYGQQKRQKDPRSKASFLSKLTFVYAGKIFGKGLRKDLQEEDLYEVTKRCEANSCSNNLEKQWEKERKRTENPSILRLLLVTFGLRYAVLGIIELVWELTKSYLEPNANGKLAAYFKPGQTAITRNDALYYASLLIGIKLIHTLYHENYTIYLLELAIQMRTSVSSLIYRKSLKLSPKGSATVSLGRIVTLLNKDVTIFDQSLKVFNEFIIGVIEAFFLSYLIYMKIGTASLTGVGICLFVLILQILCGNIMKQLRFKINKRTDHRLQTTQETLSTIKIIKMYTWESFFEKRISDARQSEMRQIFRSFYVRIVTFVCGFFSTQIGLYAVLMTYIWLGNEIDAEIVFYLMNSYGRLARSIAFLFPTGLFNIAESYAILSRIQHVLYADELDKTLKTQSSDKPKIALKNLTVKINDKIILNNISMDVKSGLTIISGGLGSGKSSLLKSILHDYPTTDGNITVSGSVSYASQDPWLFPSSIKQNILFGENYNEERYREVVRVCALAYDFQLLEKGDETIVADKGLNLSKGQQARINLARAIYRDSNIYLLDDSLTALDAHVHQFIFNECIKKFLKDKICVLVSHNTNHIQEADHVIIMENGRIKFDGKSDDLKDDIYTDYIDSIIQENSDLNTKNKLLEIKEDEEIVVNVEEKRLLTNNVAKRKIYKETNKKGGIDFNIYKSYFLFGGSLVLLTTIGVLYVVGTGIESYSKKLISVWVDEQAKVSNYSHNSTDLNETDLYSTAANKVHSTIHLFTILMVSAWFLELIKFYFVAKFVRNVSVNIHKKMIQTLINCCMQFFDNYFTGNILNRFSQDLGIIDEYIPYLLLHMASMLFNLLGVVALILSIKMIFLLPTVIVFVILYCLRVIYIPTARSLKRVEAATRSPILGHLNASMDGAATIRAYNAENVLQKEFDQHQNLFTSCYYMSVNSKAAFTFYMDLTSTIYVSFIISWFLFFDDSHNSSSGDVGLIITQANLLSRFVEMTIIQWSELEKVMTSVERVLEYIDLPVENHTSGTKIDNWPQNGAIEYNNVSLMYNNTEKVLKNVQFHVEPMQKIGIVGRTGAGKSSIISTLFRLYNFDGIINIDKIDTKQLSLKDLRENISIIPQDPILFSGSIRENIDPLKKYSDQDIWSALERCKMKQIVSSLDEIIDGGRNFSTGQRQLICLCRAIIRNNKIVILDEATANLDTETDKLVQETIRENFAKCTIFTIAHRLQTVMDCNRVMVLEKGKIIEYDDPVSLLNNNNSAFSNMCRKSGFVLQ